MIPTVSFRIHFRKLNPLPESLREGKRPTIWYTRRADEIGSNLGFQELSQSQTTKPGHQENFCPCHEKKHRVLSKTCLAIHGNHHCSSQIRNYIISTKIHINKMHASLPNFGLSQNSRLDIPTKACSTNNQSRARVALLALGPSPNGFDAVNLGHRQKNLTLKGVSSLAERIINIKTQKSCSRVIQLLQGSEKRFHFSVLEIDIWLFYFSVWNFI